MKDEEAVEWLDTVLTEMRRVRESLVLTEDIIGEIELLKAELQKLNRNKDKKKKRL